MMSYQETVLSMVHAIRVEPDDPGLKEILADKLEEEGRVGIVSRTTSFLRKNRMVVNSLDIRAITLLSTMPIDAFPSVANIDSADEEERKRFLTQTSAIHWARKLIVGYFSYGYCDVSPEDYRKIWDSVKEHEVILYATNKSAACLEVIHEAHKIRQEREELIRKEEERRLKREAFIASRNVVRDGQDSNQARKVLPA